MAVKNQVTDHDLWLLLLSTIRYSMGRRSYIAATCQDLYHRYKERLTVSQRQQILSEIKAELKIAETHKGWLGDNCDHEGWKFLAEAIEAELKHL